MIVRVLISAMLVLSALHALQRALAEPLIPVFRSTLRVLDPTFEITDVVISNDGSHQTLRFRANLAMPTQVADQILYPFGWNGSPQGGFQISLVLGSVFQYSALMLILVLSWPANRVAEFGVRLLLSVPLMTTLLLIDVPPGVLGDLCGLVYDEVDPHAVCGWRVWSRFLAGGGGLMFGCLTGGLVIAGSKRLGTKLFAPQRSHDASLENRPHTGYARLVLPSGSTGENQQASSRNTRVQF